AMKHPLPDGSNLQGLAEAALEASYDSILITDANLDHPRIVYVNPAFCQMTGWAREEVIGQTPAILQGERTDREVTRRLREALEAGRDFEGRTINYRKDGRRFHIEWRTSPVRNEKGEVTHYLAIQRDVTAHVRLMRRLVERAESDQLTELLNHGAGERELEVQIAHAAESGQPLSIVLLDIDHFKPINDEHGHQMGDLVLERIGRLINQRLNRQDTGVRWGGEEFLLILLDTNREGARQAAESFRALIEATGFHDEIRITASFGVAQWRRGDTLETLFKRADVALYEAKNAGRNRVCVAGD
ncbi:MAG: diguanylate cyclase, partial [Xanthomonadales bacterium]|nr:diguanylate cyclase [Xanthomonadales bacterium]